MVVQFEEQLHGDDDQGSSLDIVVWERGSGPHGFKGHGRLHTSLLHDPAHPVMQLIGQVGFGEVAESEQGGVQQAVQGDGGEQGKLQEHSQGLGLLVQVAVRGDRLGNTQTHRFNLVFYARNPFGGSG